MWPGRLSAQFCVHKLVQNTLILLVVSPALAGLAPGGSERAAQGYEPASRRVTVLAGQTAHLPCVARGHGDKVVSWIRPRDLHILTSGILIFTSDARFEVIHTPSVDYWGLKIKNAQLSDSGKYECQVNTDPKINFPVHLTVTESAMHDSPQAEDEADAEGLSSGGSATIHGPRDQHVTVGSTITFTCVTSRAPHLKWTHAGRDVTFQTSRGGILVDTVYRVDSVTSRLTVAMVTSQDAGDYTCQDDNVTRASVTLHVTERERSAARLSGEASSSSSPFAGATLSYLALFSLYILIGY